MLISVVIPLYNKEPIIEKSLRSVLSQDCDDFEVVVVNDGSTDKSVEIVKSINDSRVTLIEQENGGPSKARNTGVRHAKGDWILLLDADDVLLDGALKKYVGLINEVARKALIVSPYYKDNGVERVLYCKYKRRRVRNPYKEVFMGTLFVRTGAFVCPKSVLEEYMFNESLWRYEDFEVWFRLFRNVEIITDSSPVLVENSQFVLSSSPRRRIEEDFIGHLNFNKKPFWERMCLYKLFLYERLNYSRQTKKLYSFLYKRGDYFVMFKLYNNNFFRNFMCFIEQNL